MSEEILKKKGFKSKYGWQLGSCHYRKGNVEIRCVDNGTFWRVTTGNQVYAIVREVESVRQLSAMIRHNKEVTLDTYKVSDISKKLKK